MPIHPGSPIGRQDRVLIVGAGPTGLGAAYRLQELGHLNFLVCEALPYIGGLAHSFVDPHGFTWDIGGHVMFSHYAYFDRVFDRLMGDDFSLINRESWVRIMDRWVPYPFQNNVRYLPPQAACECLVGLVRAQSGPNRPSPADTRNFGEFIDAVFGEGIARHFMRPYNFKVWAHPPEMMNKHWIGERVAVIDLERAIRNVVLQLDDYGWGPNNRFKFPLRGGTGEFYRRFGPLLGLDEHGRETPTSRVRLHRRLIALDLPAKTATFSNGETERYDHLISTIPLDILCTKTITSGVPARVRDAAARLLHSAGHMVGIGIRRPCPSTKSWMYFPEDNCPFYRVTYLSNYSPFMTPDEDRYYSLLCETSASAHKPVDSGTIVDETIEGLIRAGLITREETRDIVSRWHHFAEYSYPTPSVERDEILATVIPWLESQNVYSRGRFGMWKYEVSNTDHSVMQGVEVVNRLLLEEAETTIGMVYQVTADGRTAIHDRPAVAGSGERRLTEPKLRTEVREGAREGVREGPRAIRPIGEEEMGVSGGAEKQR